VVERVIKAREQHAGGAPGLPKHGARSGGARQAVPEHPGPVQGAPGGYTRIVAFGESGWRQRPDVDPELWSRGEGRTGAEACFGERRREGEQRFRARARRPATREEGRQEEAEKRDRKRPFMTGSTLKRALAACRRPRPEPMPQAEKCRGSSISGGTPSGLTPRRSRASPCGRNRTPCTSRSDSRVQANVFASTER